MKSRTVLITGGARGIGKATAIAFAEKGYNIIISYNRTDATDTIRQIKEFGVSALSIKADITNDTERKMLAEKAVEEFCGLDVLVNNAGIMWQGLFTDMTQQEWQNIFNVNVTGSAMLTKEILPHMISRKRGAIINVSSVWGELGASTEVAYSASKAALIGFSKALAKELEPSGISVHYITPGAVATDMLSQYSKQELIEIENKFGKILTPDEIGQSILHCLDN